MSRGIVVWKAMERGEAVRAEDWGKRGGLESGGLGKAVGSETGNQDRKIWNVKASQKARQGSRSKIAVGGLCFAYLQDSF